MILYCKDLFLPRTKQNIEMATRYPIFVNAVSCPCVLKPPPGPNISEY